jgi:glutamate racemase
MAAEMTDLRPIGIFDSGVGGLTLLRELDNLMPYENFIYVGDTERMPYGTKSEEEIICYSEEIIKFLESRNCKLILIACNTVSCLLPELDRRENHEVQVVGIINYGCVAAALYVTYNFRIGVWATQRTIESGVYKQYIDNFDPSVQIITQPCTELVTLIEQGAIGSPTTRDMAEKYLRPMLRDDIDTLILGCTHLPFIKNIIQDIVTVAVTLIDPARRTAVICMKILHDNGTLLSDHRNPGTRKFYVTGDPAAFMSTAQLLVGPLVDKVEHTDLKV